VIRETCGLKWQVRLIDDKTEAADVDMVAGQPTHFLIHAKDANAVLKSIGGDQFIVTAIAPDKSKMTGKVSRFVRGSVVSFVGWVVCRRNLEHDHRVGGRQRHSRFGLSVRFFGFHCACLISVW
jgi:hypothetical protein